MTRLSFGMSFEGLDAVFVAAVPSVSPDTVCACCVLKAGLD